MNTTAKIKVTGKTPVTDGQTILNFGADYADDRNKEWSKYTPALSLGMTVLDSVAERFELGQSFTLTFTPEHT
jgi:hypothetical protein